MGKPRCKWWGYIRRVLRAYPYLRKELDELQKPMQSKGEQVCRGSGVGRPVEMMAAVTLPDRQEQLELEAVEKAMSEVDEISNKLVEMVFFKGTHTLEGAAQRLFISYRTARRRQAWFICSVAENLGLTE